MSRIITAALAVIVLSGCAELVNTPVSIKTGFPAGGSRADGTVTLVYDVDSYETYQVNWEGMQKQAQDMCVGWGYSTAERVEGELSDCIQHSMVTNQRCAQTSYSYSGESYCERYQSDTDEICRRWRVRIMYQCRTALRRLPTSDNAQTPG